MPEGGQSLARGASDSRGVPHVLWRPATPTRSPPKDGRLGSAWREGGGCHGRRCQGCWEHPLVEDGAAVDGWGR